MSGNGFLGLGKLFRKLKEKMMGDILNKILAKVIQWAKFKSPKVWAIVVAVASGLQFGFDGLIEVALNGIGFDIDLPSGFLSLDWIITHTGLQIGDRYTDWFMWFLAAIIGSNVKQFLPEKDQEVALDKQAERIAEQKQKEAAREARRAARKAK